MTQKQEQAKAIPIVLIIRNQESLHILMNARCAIALLVESPM
jgi:hypothetical protein